MHHILTINHPCQLAEEGFIIGNGNLSASCYQKPGKIVFQLGKNDFWDERLDLSQNPRPAHIRELEEAIDKGITVDGVTFEVSGVPPEAGKRIAEIARRPFSQQRNAPMPKPAMTLYIHYPADWSDCQWRQLLDIESGLLTIEITHFDGAQLILKAVIHPEVNRLTIDWELKNYTPDIAYGGYFFGLPKLPKVYATMFRPDEVSIKNFAEAEMLEHGNNYFNCAAPFPEFPPLTVDGEILFQKNPGGKDLSGTLCGSGEISGSSGKFLRLLPAMDACAGSLSAVLSTDRQEDIRQLAKAGDWEKDRIAAAKAAEDFWQRSSVTFDDEILERSWYASMHVKRSILRHGTVPPGLFIPSSLQDYSMWKGDYHFNYNYQSIFLGDYEANHISVGDTYFDGVEYVMKLGEKISRDYYDIDGGCFIQLSGYPFHADDDYFGSLPLGRMAYMTGWVAAYFYRRWDLTRDKEFLQKTGYPALKKFATFYEKFLKKDADGVYHAYPSNQGESEFSRTGATDKTQVLLHANFALIAAANAADALAVDREKAELWRHIAANMPLNKKPDDYPEFEAFDGEYLPEGTRPDFLTVGNRFHDFYMGQMPYKLSIALRQQQWNPEWHDELLTFVRRWILPNGTFRGVSACTHNFRGGWTESLGIAGALTDMLMTSSAFGITRIFPGIPDNRSAKFSNLRSSGAFLISAEKDAGQVKYVEVCAESGGTLKLVNPWKKALLSGRNITSDAKIIVINMTKGETLTLKQA